MDRCWLHGAVGDALHALTCAAGYNIRWLLRAIARLGLRGLFCALSAVATYALAMLQVMPFTLGRLGTAAVARPSASHRLNSVALAIVE